MKIVILGDTHGRMCWYDIINKEKPDKVIFMGDYVSTHDDISEDQQCCNLEDILNYKTDNPDKVVLLRGNHDIQHLNYYWAECTGYFRGVAEYMMTIKDRFLKNTQWVHIEDNLLFSHAGISKTWWNSLDLGEPTKDNILKINGLEPSELFGFTPTRLDTWGNSVTQPCTWIRPASLISDAVEGWGQVVGHTPLKFPGNVMSLVGDDIDKYPIKELWCVDALPNKYMVIDGDVKEMRNV